MSVKRETPAERKALPIARGVLDYFPDALLAIAEVSRVGNEQHNPGQPMHWAKEKSTDEADALLRHLIDRGKLDSDGLRHSAKVAWRALALLQRELDAEAEAAEEPVAPSVAPYIEMVSVLESMPGPLHDAACMKCGQRGLHVCIPDRAMTYMGMDLNAGPSYNVEYLGSDEDGPVFRLKSR